MKKPRWRILRFTLILAILLAAMSVTALASGAPEENNNFYVSGEGIATNDGLTENKPTTLEHAVEIAVDGDTIYVMGDLTVSSTITIDKDLTIIGNNEEKPTISQKNDSSPYYSIFDIGQNTTVTLHNLAFCGTEVNAGNSYSGGSAFYGGAIIIGNAASGDNDYSSCLNITDCTFNAFEAHQGGAICVINADNVELNIGGSSFGNNVADVGGGAICEERCANFKLTLDDCTFFSNSAGKIDGDGFTYGGAVFINQGFGEQLVKIQDCTFKANFSIGRGGAICAVTSSSRTGTINLIDSNFVENKTYYYINSSNISDGNGGAAYFEYLEELNINGCTFSENFAGKYGGAMNITGSSPGMKVTIEGSLFEYNKADGQGGAINLSNAWVNTNIDSVLFESNTTDYKIGNAIVFFASSNAVTNSIINPTTGAAFYNNGSNEDGVDRDTICVYPSKNNITAQRCVVKITNYMLDGTRLHWKSIETVNENEYQLIDANRSDYANITGSLWNSGAELYLDAETEEPSYSESQYSNIFIGNHAQYGGAISNYGSLTIGDPGDDITVTKTWANEEQQEHDPVTVNLVRVIDNKVLDTLTFGTDEEWAGTFFDFPTNVQYTITEENVAEYTASITYNGNNVTVTNTRQATTYTLSYNSNGGTEYEDELHLEGTEVQLDKVPERDGHTFTGWFADEDLTQQIATITMNDHSTVHAGWEKDEEPWTPPITTPETPTEPSEPDYTPNWLNTTDHVSYIIGYEDGTVKPNAGITRAEVATIFFRLLTDGARERFWSETNAYSDVAAGSWYNIAVSTLSNMGILGGYEDGTFRPNASITRAEFAKIAVSFFDWADVYAVNNFVDVRDSAWYANYVAVAAELGLIEGYGGNVFRPDATITRAEACTIINRTLGRAPDADHLLPVAQMNTWPDNADTGVWYYAQIQEATNSHDYRWIGSVEQWTAKLADPDWDKLQY